MLICIFFLEVSTSMSKNLFKCEVLPKKRHLELIVLSFFTKQVENTFGPFEKQSKLN